MISATPLSPDLQERIHLIWDEVAAFEAAKINEALVYLLTAVAELVDAQNAYWFAAVRVAPQILQ